MTSLNTVSELFGGTAPHSLTELYGKSFSDGTSAPASGAINLRAFNGKTPIPTLPPSYGSTNVTSTISPSPLTYTSSDTAYTLNIAGPIGPQSADTPDIDVRGIDVNTNDNVTVRVYDRRYSGYSQLRFWGNFFSRIQGSVSRPENDTFNSRFEPPGGYQYVTATDAFGADAVVSWYIPIPWTVTKIEFYYTNTTWAGFSITIT